ncbi:S-layer homology domain-containing protein [Bhargavaea ginsengi]|uniref:S-layer homology domain-containing protein n=1 Tax=Bhargavaea ginsengi TaxID=426757 RepID=UPI0020417D26|nr:S-layer homology domain-containing protein [Bhargavaea ginsengi]MCM3088684.1 S-layer homology domain-containing protein [Bhargavaea ginsengi]
MKSLIKWGLAAVIAVGTLLPSAAFAQGYSDVTEKDTHYENILAAQELGLMTGYADGTFQSSKPLQRANVIKALGKLQLGLIGETLETYPYYAPRPFRDIPRTHPDKELFKYSIIVRDAGIFEGDSNGNVNPDKLMTRQQMAKVLVNAFGLWQVGDIDETAITDLDQAAWYFQDYILLLSHYGVTTVSEYRPLATTTRGQFASFLVRAYDVMTDSPVEYIEEYYADLLPGEQPELPDRLYVFLQNGAMFYTPVEWDMSELDTSTPGEYVITGTLKEFPGETAVAMIYVYAEDEWLEDEQVE